MEERIIIVSKDTLVEADVITGANVITLQNKYLIRIDRKGNNNIIYIFYFY